MKASKTPQYAADETQVNLESKDAQPRKPPQLLIGLGLAEFVGNV